MSEKTLTGWLIEEIDGKNYRAGKASGKRHPKVDKNLLKVLGGRESLVSQARVIERDDELGGSGLIWFDWRDLNTDISTIHYSVDIMHLLCRREGIEDPRERQLRYIEALEYWADRVKGTWLYQYYREEIRKLEEGYCSQTLQSQLEDGNLYRCLDEIMHLEEPMEKPIFSAKVFQNVKIPGAKIPPSKIFRKRYEGKVISILKYSPKCMDGMSGDEILAAHGILSYAQTLEWKGPLGYVLDTGDEIDSSANVYGTIINARTLEHGTPKSLAGVKKIFIIENKADYEKKDFSEEELSIFCHGFFSPKEIRFLKKIVEIADEKTEYYHWGDMDYGGIRIFQFNKANVFPKLRPYRMNRGEYEQAVAAGAGIPIDEGKRKKLEDMEAGELEELKQCILEYGVEVEQENIEILYRCAPEESKEKINFIV